MDEKDRLGQFFDKKERAEENRFFAERDRKLIERLRQKKLTRTSSFFMNSSTCAVPGVGSDLPRVRSMRSR